MRQLVIIGTGGHGRMIKSQFASQSYDLVLWKDGGADLANEYPDAVIALGIGRNDDRKRLYDELVENGREVMDFEMPNAIVNIGAVIGKNVILNTGCIVEHDCMIDDHAHICPGAILCGGVHVGEGAVIGAGAVVKDGLTIGEWAMIGCGAVVVKDVPAYCTYVGNPAKPMMNQDFERDGFVVVRQLTDAQPLRSILAELVLETYSGRSITRVGDVVNSVHGVQHKALIGLLESPRMRCLASTCLGETAVPRAVEIFAKPAHVGLLSPWHQDNAYWCLKPAKGLTIWIALDECDEHNGGLSYIRGSHQRGLRPHQPSYAPGSSQMIGIYAGYKGLTPALHPGDASLHHCLTVHGSAANRSNKPRRGITLQYQGVSVQVNEDKKRAYEASLEEQVRGRA